MFLSRFRYVVIITLLAVGLTACDQGSPRQPQSESYLKQAMAVAPASTEMLAFTDWTLLKKYMGLENLPAKRTEAQLKELLSKLESQQPAAFLQREMVPFEPEGSLLDMWSWDFVDLLWEGELTFGNKPPVLVLKFRENFDFAPVVAHYKERGFAETEYAGAKIYSHNLDMTADWEQSGRFLAFYNTAVIEEKKMLVLSISNGNDVVRSVLDAAQKGGSNVLGDKPTVDMVDSLGEVGAATILPGASGCKFFDVNLFADGSPAVKAALGPVLDKINQTHKYDAAAEGYRYDGKQSLAFVALHYSSSDDAKSDVDIRESLLADGDSLTLERGLTYGEILKSRKGEYQVDVEGSTLMLKVKGDYMKDEVNGGERNLVPRTLFNMLMQRDMTFAFCR